MQTGGGAREFERLRARGAGIERLRFARRRGDQLDAHVVEGVDQDDEALRLILLAGRYDGDVVEDKGVKALRELEIIGGAEWATAEGVKVESCDSIDRLRHIELTTEQLDCHRRALLMAGQRQERRVERGVRLRAKRRIVDRRALELLEPVVGAGVELDHLEPLFDERDERQEQSAI